MMFRLRTKINQALVLAIFKLEDVLVKLSTVFNSLNKFKLLH